MFKTICYEYYKEKTKFKLLTGETEISIQNNNFQEICSPIGTKLKKYGYAHFIFHKSPTSVCIQNI